MPAGSMKVAPRLGAEAPVSVSELPLIMLGQERNFLPHDERAHLRKES